MSVYRYEAEDAQEVPAPRRANARLLWSHPAHFIAFGAGSGLSPIAPGTVGTLWGWASFAVIQAKLGFGPDADIAWAGLLIVSWLIGWWACTHTARSLNVSDPGSVVWDEIWAIWLVLWIVTPMDWIGQLVAVVAFRLFDMVKPGPVRWADQLFKHRPGQRIGWLQGLGIMFDDLVAALCTLFVLAAAIAVRHGGLGVSLLP